MNLSSLTGGIGGGLVDWGLGEVSAQNQRRASQRMYRHRYQWQMEDMLKAGLNPILAGNLGASGGPSMSSGGSGNVTNSALAAKMQAEQLEGIRQDNRTKKATADIAEKAAKPSGKGLDMIDKGADAIVEAVETMAVSTAKGADRVEKLGPVIKKKVKTFLQDLLEDDPNSGLFDTLIAPWLKDVQRKMHPRGN